MDTYNYTDVMVCACKYRYITILCTYQMVRCLLDWITTKSLHRRRLWQRKITYLQSATKYCALDLRSRRYAVRQYTLMQILVYLLKLQHFLVLIITSIITTTCTYTYQLHQNNPFVRQNNQNSSLPNFCKQTQNT